MTRVYSVLEIIGTIAFAISGASTAIKKEMDLLGVVVLGVITAVGGGIFRDVLSNFTPSIFYEREIICLAIISSVVTFVVLWIKIDFTETRTFFWILTVSDALGLAMFTIFGCQKMFTWYNGGVLVFFGVLTGVGGGVIRDIIAGQTPYVLSKHFYACSCIIGSVVYIALHDFDKGVATIVGMVVIFVTRMLAVKYKWNLPKINMESNQIK